MAKFLWGRFRGFNTEENEDMIEMSEMPSGRAGIQDSIVQETVEDSIHHTDDALNPVFELMEETRRRNLK